MKSKSLSLLENRTLLFFTYIVIGFFICLFVCLFVFAFFRATPLAYGSSRTRVRSRATTAGLHHSYSNEGSEPHLQPTRQFTAMPDP